VVAVGAGVAQEVGAVAEVPGAGVVGPGEETPAVVSRRCQISTEQGPSTAAAQLAAECRGESVSLFHCTCRTGMHQA